MNIKEHIVHDHSGKPIAVQIPMHQYKRIMEKLEELDDIKAYDTAMKRKKEFIPFDIVVKELKATRSKS